MKMIKAMIRPEKFEDVKAGLDNAGFGAMTIFDVEGRGVQKGIKQQLPGCRVCRRPDSQAQSWRLSLLTMQRKR